MYHEAAALARELDPRWNYRSAELMTLYAKAKAFEAGEQVEFGGKQFAPLYTPRNDTLINLFRITDDEQRKLRTIISRDVAAERHRKREEKRRRAAGAKAHSSEQDRAAARLMRAQGMSLRAIAAELGVSKSTVSDWCK
jgi:DNA-directed RNA polymerase specialized sigma24 family protein